MAFARANGWAGVARFGGIGDNLIAASVCGALKRKGLKVEMITSDPCWQVFEHNPNIDKLSVKSKAEVPTDMKEWQKWFAGRAEEYDVFAHLSHSCENSLALFPMQTQFYWPAAVRRRICGRNYLEFVHDIAGVPYEFGPLFYASAEEKEQAAETKAKIGGRVILWVISGTRIDKVYPFAPMAIARLIKELDAQIVVTGSPGKNFADAKLIMEHVERQLSSNKGLHSAISDSEAKTEWPLRRSLAFAQCADLVVTPDTGIAWSVAFAPMPKVMLISHASPENITKHWLNTVTLSADQSRVPCWPCHQLHDEPRTCTPNKENNGAACITDISVERLVSTVKELWNQQEKTNGECERVSGEGNAGLGTPRSNPDASSDERGRLVPRCPDERERLGDHNGERLYPPDMRLRSSSVPWRFCD
jgi:ADP-heptose:LPS heptosyltransferase